MQLSVTVECKENNIEGKIAISLSHSPFHYNGMNQGHWLSLRKVCVIESIPIYGCIPDSYQ